MNPLQLRRHGRAVAWTVAAALMATIATLWWITPKRPTGTVTGPQGSTATCVEAGGNSDSGYCQRVAEDALRRRALSPEQRKAAEDQYNAVQRALSSRTRCVPATTTPCAPATGKRPPNASDADLSLKKLYEAGFANSTVRIARVDDPAPAGSLLYAVPLANDSCIVGHILEVPGGSGGGIVGGVLPDGKCLNP